MNKFLIGIITIGLSISLFYGLQWWNAAGAVEKVSQEEISTWEEASTEINEMAVMDGPDRKTAGEEKVYSEQVSTYEKGEQMGRLIIPMLNKGYTTYWGADEDSLKRGVGMYVSEWTTTPDEKGHTVLSGHRETVFTNLGDIKQGDSLFYEYEQKRYEYKVEKTWITDADDRSVIVDKKDPTLTLTTCYPFNFVGDAPERYIIQASLVHVSEMDGL
ncbi:class D sortase [Halobacillus kuroshimensis]|uniref:Class D sortase n=1 Tax=Halobacillus kuroshimensis TaxID=302481 RepID=A0ABS3DU48_9BACI|nr:class D sortase [Halobacillus kuroshimensis]MBN8234846.1 class D sortase [Halobacillus kuroshimensis]